MVKIVKKIEKEITKERVKIGGATIGKIAAGYAGLCLSNRINPTKTNPKIAWTKILVGGALTFWNIKKNNWRSCIGWTSAGILADGAHDLSTIMRKK